MPETMTSRERVLKAINHEEADRMPIDLGMHYSTGISAFAYYNLREYLGLPTDNIVIPDTKQFLARVDEDVLKRFHCDCILLYPGWKETLIWNPRGKYKFVIPSSLDPKLDSDGSWVIENGEKIIRMPEAGFFFDGPGDGGAETRPFDEVLKALKKEAMRIYHETDFFTVYIGFGAYFSDNIDFMCNMLTNPEHIHEINKKQLENDLKKAEMIIDNLGSYIQGLCVNSDLGSQQGPFCNPNVWRELSKPYLKEFCSFVHRNSDLKIFMHCCGSIKPYIEDLIECGIDILNPVQISANNMNPKQLKEEFGSRITFWGGGCDTQRVLNNGTPDDVKVNVRELVSVFKPGGGFVFNQVHNIMGDIKPENIVAMFDTAYEESFYIK